MAKKRLTEWDPAERGRGNWISLLLMASFLVLFFQYTVPLMSFYPSLVDIVHQLRGARLNLYHLGYDSSAGSVKRQAPLVNTTSSFSVSNQKTITSTVSTVSTSSGASTSTTTSVSTSSSINPSTSTNTSISTGTTNTTPPASNSSNTVDEGWVVDPRTPAGSAKFVYPVNSLKNYTVQQVGTRMPITWEFKDVIVLPKNLTLQIKLLDAASKKPIDQIMIAPGIIDPWTTIAENFTYTQRYEWLVNVPEGDGYLLRLFDSSIGPLNVKPGALQTSVSSKFAVYRTSGKTLGPDPFSASPKDRSFWVAYAVMTLAFLMISWMVWI